MNRNIYKLMSATALLLSSFGAGAQLITTVAGTGVAGAQAAGGPAILQQLSSPTGVCFDFTINPPYGALFIADSGANLVRMVDMQSGSISTVAGGGTTGLGDGKAATLAQLSFPTGVSTDGAGMLYIADMGNARIRKVILATNVISTAAGGGVSYGDGGFAAVSKLNVPYHVKVSPTGNIYIADKGDNVIRMINATSLKISTVAGIAGTGSYSMDGGPATNAEMGSPAGIAIDNKYTNYVYFTDRSNNVIRRIDAGTGVISTIAGTSYAGYSGDNSSGLIPATNAQFTNPSGIYFVPHPTASGKGALYVCDRDNNVIRVYDEFGKYMSLFAGSSLTTAGSTNGNRLTAATFTKPTGIWANATKDTFYVADMGSNQIRAIYSSNVVTLAGSVGPGASGDDGPASSATLNAPTGVYRDKNGDLLVADAGNNVLRKITLHSGCISGFTIFNPGTGYVTGDVVTFTSGGVTATATVIAPAGMVTGLIFSSYGTGFTAPSVVSGIGGSGDGMLKISISSIAPAIVRVAGYYGSSTLESGDGGAALSAALPNPTNVTVDAFGKIYVTSTGFQLPSITGNRVRVIDPATGLINAYYGNSTGRYNGTNVLALSVAAFKSPEGLAFNSSNDLLVASTGDHYIQWRVNGSHPGYVVGNSYAYAGNGTDGYGGLGSSEYLHQPCNIASGVSGAFYIADRLNHVIRQVDARGVMSSVSGVANAPGYTPVTGIAHNDKDELPSAVAYYPLTHTLYYADQTGSMIRKVDFSVTPPIDAPYAGTANIFGSADAGSAGAATFMGITGLDVNTGNGDLYVADCKGNKVRLVSATGMHPVTTVAGTGIYGMLGGGGPATSAQLNNPYSVITDAGGNMYIADRNNSIIRKVDVAGTITTYAGTGTAGYSGDGMAATTAQLSSPTGISMDGSGNMYIADNGNNVIRKVDASGIMSTFLGTWGSVGDNNTAPIKFYYPYSVLVNKSGTKVFIADGNNHKVKLYTGGTLSNYAGSGTPGYTDGTSALTATLADPKALAFSVTEDTLYIADFSNNAVRMIKTSLPTPLISTVAGEGPTIGGYTGDGLPATGTALYQPSGVCVDQNSNLIISDNSNNRIRRVVYSTGIMKTMAGNGIPGYSGDGGQATKAEINNPYGICINPLNELLVADVSNNVIRKVTPVLIAQFTETGNQPGGGMSVCQDSCMNFISNSIGDIDVTAWSVSPAGPTISAPAKDTTNICFPNAGSYVITLTITAGTNTATSTITVDVTPTPHPIVTRSGHFDLSIATSPDYSSYQWYDASLTIIPGANHENYTVPSIGAYTIGVDSAGCPGFTTYTVTNSTSVRSNTTEKNKYWLSQQGDDQNTVHIYAARPLYDGLKVSMFDASGRAIFSDMWNTGSNNITIKAATLAPGMYMIRLNNNTTTEVLKWLKN